MKSELIAGDTLDFETSVPDYPRSESWTLTYKLVPRSSGSVITFAATGDAENADDYRVQVSASTTANWTAGEYSWAAYVSKASERYTVDNGTLKVLADPGAVSTLDSRSHARKVLEAIEAAIEALNLGTKSYTIGQRAMTKRDLPEIYEMRVRYKREVEAEDAQARLDAGLSGAPRLLARF